MADRPRLIDSVKAVRSRPMRLLVLSAPRTGTESLNAALEQLGYNVFSFGKMMSNWRETIPLWTEAIEAKHFGKGKPYDREEFDKLLGDYDVVKCPHALLFSEELVKAYPEARVIITLRDFESWKRSMDNTIWPLRHSVGYRLLHRFDDFRRVWWPFMCLVIDTAYVGWEENSKEMYEEHHRQMRKLVPPSRLLEFWPKDGWKPLCTYLEVPVPNAPFPRVNASNALKEQGRDARYALLKKAMLKISAGGVVVMVTVTLLGLGIQRLYK
ncbi:P-loop containing nucleoside triphosphate hydrolase protein [Paraphoma chrysanthemicola]|uniref:P-loop containing nucleoside triphosphate hydrolase protein n=1 Tax=Paraphoma chrysanthemicola TaxID=798071 RepID=A0A8K0RGG3_9PLEO|nr:P-loop containing nucleoside triphosphate hydrolase protein [Paraphoma chrysanthemicola]